MSNKTTTTTISTSKTTASDQNKNDKRRSAPTAGSSSSRSNQTRRQNSEQPRSKQPNSEAKRISEVEYLNIQDDEIAATSSLTINNKTKLTSNIEQRNVTSTNIEPPPPHQDQPQPPQIAAGAAAGRSSNSRRFTSEDNDFNDHEQYSPLSSLTGAVNSSKLTKNLLFAVLASTVGSSFQHGYNIGVINAPEKLIGQFINETYSRRHPNDPSGADETKIDMIFSVIVSIYCIGGCIGALLTAIVADTIGRKEGLFYNNILVLLACPMMASSRSLNSYELLIFGRFIIGINAGLNAGLAPLYLNEISPLELRGALGTIYQLIITVSILLSNIFGLPGLFGSQQLWPLLFALPLIPAALMLVTLPHCCESPKHILLNKGHELEAQQALAWFRGTGDIQEEMDDLRNENERQKLLPPIKMKDLIEQRSLRRPLIISVVIMLSQQFSGINAVLFFSTSIFRDAGLGQASALKATLGMSLANVLMTIVSLFLVDKMGRKTLHMSGLMGMTVTCLILAVCLGGSPTVNPDPTSSFIAVISVYVFIIMFASGPGSIPWFIVSELFPSNVRPAASSIAVAVNWLANFTVSLCFLPISNILHGFTFFIFAALLTFFFLFTYFKVPETKGVTSEEISALFMN